MILKSILPLTLIMLMLSSPASLFAEGQKMRIAIMDFKAQNVSRAEAVTLSELIMVEMVKSGSYIVLERDQMNQILLEQGFQGSKCADDSCAARAGKLLSASKILVGSFIRFDDRIIIMGRIVDVEKGTADFSEKVTAESRSDFDAAAERFVKRLTDRMLGKKPEPEKKTKYKTVIYSTGSDLDTYQQCGYSSLAFFIGAAISGIPAAAYQFRYAKAKRDYNNYKTMYNMTTVFMGDSTFQLFGLMQVMGMRKDVSNMKSAIRSRDTALYVMAGFGGLSFVMAAATLGTYLNPDSHAFMKRMDAAKFAVYPAYYCEPPSGYSAAYNHHFNMMTYYRF